MSEPLVPEKRRSALEAFTECPFRWHQLYVRGIADQSPAARRGTSYHAAAKFYIRSLFEHRESMDLELARAAFHRGQIEAPAPADLFEDVHDLFWTWAERFELDVEAYLLNEERPEDPEDYKLQIDLAYGRGDVLEIIDFKTHYRIWPAAAARKKFQPRFYLARARRIWPGYETYRLVFHFVRFGVDVAVEYDAAELDRIDEQIEAIAAAQLETLRGGIFEATPGDHCGLCALECPAAADAARAPVRILTEADRDRIAGEYLALTQAVASRRQALEAFCTGSGDFSLGDVAFGFKKSERTKYPAAKVIDVLRKKDIEPSFSIGTTPLKSYLTAKKWAHVRPELERLGERTPSTTFQISRAVIAEQGEEGEE